MRAAAGLYPSLMHWAVLNAPLLINGLVDSLLNLANQD